MGDESQDNKLVPMVVGELITAAKDSPDMKDAGRNTAAALKIIATTVKHALIPLAAVNFAIEKAQEYFKDKFEADLAEKAENIPPEYIVDPKASIAGPALQALAFTHEEAPLKEMYLNLLASAMDSRRASDVHPAFVEVIRQLSAAETPILSFIIGHEENFALGQVRVGSKNNYRILLNNLTNFRNGDGTPYVNPKLSSMIDNWARLGLVDTSYLQQLANSSAYENLETRPEFVDLKQQYEAGEEKVTLQKGVLSKTDFGKDFAVAIGVRTCTRPAK